MFKILKNWSDVLKSNIYALYLASKDPRVPSLAKILIALVIAYAISPIDLIPDFIPVLGYLDDLIILPLGIWLAIHLIPVKIWNECKVLAVEQLLELHPSRRMTITIIFIWIIVVVTLALWLLPIFNNIKSV